MRIINYMKQEDYWLIGSIKRAKNSNDAWEVQLDRSIEELPPVKEVFVLMHNTYVPFSCKKWEEQGNKILMSLGNDSSISDDNIVARKEIFLPVALMEPYLEKSPFKLVNYAVYNKEENTLLGYVNEVIPRALQPILSIQHESSNIMIPFHDAFVSAINHDEKKMEVKLPKDYLTKVKEA